MDQGLLAEPVQQSIAVASGEHVVERVFPPGPSRRRERGRKQVEVVIAEHGHGAVAERAHEAQHVQRIGTAVDEVTGEPQPISVRLEPHPTQERSELSVAALDVANRVRGHGNIPRGAGVDSRERFAYVGEEVGLSTQTCADLDAALTRLGYASFRPGQREAIETLFEVGRLLLVAPTGGGKSLTYQLPATLLPGTSLVISPLVSLMADQVAALESHNVSATYLAATLAPDEIKARMRAMSEGRYKLVYVAPERLAFEGFRALLAKLECPLVAVDEAHCISEWGHDFRPEYMQIGELISSLHGCRVLACTATATPVQHFVRRRATALPSIASLRQTS
jgi:hypothetical protein